MQIRKELMRKINTKTPLACLCTSLSEISFIFRRRGIYDLQRACPGNDMLPDASQNNAKCLVPFLPVCPL